MLSELDEWLSDNTPKMLIVGELQDGLVFDSAYLKVTGLPLTHWLIPKFAAQSRHRLIFLTKSAEIEHALKLKANRQVVFSWSVNAEEVGSRWEAGAPLPSERFAAAEAMQKAGWPIRFRIDPMVPYPGWRGGYMQAIRRVNRLKPEMVTLGALRATSAKSLRKAAIKNGRDDAIFDFLSEEKDASGFKYRIPLGEQIRLFRFVLEHLDPAIPGALCKEDRTVWEALAIPFRGCHCLLGGEDTLIEDRRSHSVYATGGPTATPFPILA
jgi:spore photoproduct lyase